MIIKSIKFENFRPFYGIQKMDFTCEDDKNVVVVLAQNACGKTTLILSFTLASLLIVSAMQFINSIVFFAR